MNFSDFTAQKDDSGRKLSKILSLILEGTQAKPFEIIRKNLVRINDCKVKNDCIINEGDKISVAEFLFQNQKKTEKNAPSSSENSKPNENKTSVIFQEPQILFENQHICVLNKPQGINVQPGTKNEINLTDYFLNKFASEKKSLSFNPGPLHRLDKFTTGAICFSKSLEGARWFSENINSHKICKIYAGIAEGSITENQCWKDYLEDADSANKSSGSKEFHRVKVSDKNEIVAQENNKSKLCITYVYPVETKLISGKKYTVCLYKIETGRKHQIRCQSSIHGHPLAGDTAYNSKPFFVSGNKIKAFLLHALILRFPENTLGIPNKISAPLPQDFKFFTDSDLLNRFAESIIF